MAVQQLLAGYGGAAPTDPNFASVKSLLHFDGADLSTTFTDQIGKTWTPAATAVISTTQSKFGGASGRSNANTSYISATASADFDMGTGDFTQEAWIYSSGTSAGCPMINDQATSNKFLAFFMDSDTSARVLIAGANQITGMTPPSAAWFHYALVRSGTTLTAYINGTSAGSVTYASNIGGNDAVTLMNSATHGGFRGHVDDFRLTKGVARYTDTFSVPTAPFPDS